MFSPKDCMAVVFFLQSQKWDKGTLGQGKVKVARCMLAGVGIVLKPCQGARDMQIA